VWHFGTLFNEIEYAEGKFKRICKLEYLRKIQIHAADDMDMSGRTASMTKTMSSKFFMIPTIISKIEKKELTPRNAQYRL
jgi:hypothetical protein